MATKRFSILFTILLCMVGTKAFAYDIIVDNADGEAFFYNYINDGTELEVTSGNWGDYNMEDVYIPEEVTISNRTLHVTRIGEDAFKSYTRLSSVTIPNSVTSIGSAAFALCTSLTSVTISNSVISIGDEAFVGCTNLSSITIPNSVRSIGEQAFRDCGLSSVFWGNSVTSIGEAAFYGCWKLSSVNISDLTAWCYIVFNSKSSNPLVLARHLFLNGTEVTDLVIPNNVTSINDYVFSGCNSLTSVTIPNSVTTIGGGAFSDCSSLTSVTIPASVTSIGDNAFYGCSGLTSIDIPPSVTSIGGYAFMNCSGLTSVTILKNLKNIGECTFKGCNSLTSVNIPNSVTSIGRSAFGGCSGLTSFTIPNSVKYIDNSAFDGCSSLTSITIPQSVTYIGRCAFQSCRSLTSLTIPKNVEFIDDYAFQFCSSLTSIVVERGNTVYDSRNDCNAIINTQSNKLIQGCMNSTIPNSVIAIGDGAFSGLGLTSITIPNSVISIGMNAFFYCNSLTSVTIPNSVTSIDFDAFAYCSDLTSVTIGKNVSSINGAFLNCSSLTKVISLNETPSSIDSYAFSTNTFNNATLYVPKGTIDIYQVTKGWKDFSHIEEINSNIMCATPTISYKDGKLSFNCETEDAECHTTITDEDIKSFDGNEINLTVTYNISVYATKNNYVDSDVATATLCWIEANPQNEGITTDVNQIASVAVLIKANGGQLTIEGANDNTTVTAYTLDGVQLGSAVSRNGVATINTNVSAGTVTIVKIGNKSVKVVMR